MPTLRRVRVEGSGTGAAVGVARKPWVPVLSPKLPTICPASLMPKATVPKTAPGTSIWVKLPPVSRKPWTTRAVEKLTDDLPRVVDAGSLRSECARHVDLGEAAAGVEEAVGTRAVAKTTDDLPRVVDAVALVKVAPGTSIWVKLPPVLRKPWTTRAVENSRRSAPRR